MQDLDVKPAQPNYITQHPGTSFAISGFSPILFLMLRLPPILSSASHVSLFPANPAKCSGVFPLLQSCAFTEIDPLLIPGPDGWS